MSALVHFIYGVYIYIYIHILKKALKLKANISGNVLAQFVK